MSSNANDLVLFLGHFHPMLVHLPIGTLVLLGILELMATFPRFKDVAQNKRVVLVFSAAGLAVAVACGWLLAESGDYDIQLLRWHRLSGFGVAGGCVLTLLLSEVNRRLAYRVSLLATLVLLVVAGHFGSGLTHGRDFLTRYAPAPLRALFGEPGRPKTSHTMAADLMQRQIFMDVVQPILEQRCSRCHGPEKQKGELRVDNLAALRQGGQGGPALVAGKAAESLMIRRLLLPLSQDDHMPPEGKPQPTSAEIGLLEWWINAGAPETRIVGDLKPDADIVRMLKTDTRGITE